DDVTLHEVVVEAHRSAFVRRELGVGQMFPADGFDPVRRMRGGGRWRRSHRRGYRTTVRTFRRSAPDHEEQQQKAQSCRPRPHVRTSNWPIIRMSSCSMLWQWNT